MGRMNERGRRDALWPAVLLWGGLWGVWEAAAGPLVHAVKVPGLPGTVMFPAALFFMSRAYERSGQLESIFLAACAAAGLKLVDLLLPGQLAQAALRPALAILLEALAVTGFQAFFGRPARALARHHER